jgi:hypothetical protein
MKPSEFFAKIAGSFWLVGFGGSVLVLILRWTDVIQGASFPWRNFLLFFGIGGLVAMLVAGLFGIWDTD